MTAQDHQKTPTTATLDVERLTTIVHDLNMWSQGLCDHSMYRIHDDDRPGYERSCLLDARYIAEKYALLSAGDKAEAPPTAPDGSAQEFAARHGIPLPEGLHLDSHLNDRRKP